MEFSGNSMIRVDNHLKELTSLSAQNTLKSLLNCLF